MATSKEIFREAMTLSPEVRAELAERLIGSLAEDVSPEITSAHLAEVKRRIAEVESGEAKLIPGDEVLARARRLLAERTPTS
jgi:putative addiction module component (TIGR02574 family)